MTDNPWRERNLERIAQARRILTEARQQRDEGTDTPTPPDEPEEN